MKKENLSKGFKIGEEIRIIAGNRHAKKKGLKFKEGKIIDLYPCYALVQLQNGIKECFLYFDLLSSL